MLFLSQKIGAPAVPKNALAAEQFKVNALVINLQLQLAQAPPARRPMILQRLQQLVRIDNRLKARGSIPAQRRSTPEHPHRTTRRLTVHATASPW